MNRTAGRRARALIATTSAVAVFTLPAMAGMPTPPTLTDVATLRVQAISFFLLVLLLSAKLIQFLWNRLRSDFTKLPRLTYGKAVALVVLWGLLFVIVLTMISGARELMTPGAWDRNGATYKLSSEGGK
jgi:hypothetical protein